MKIQCDVCTSAVASVFCCADEAALCSACDCKVHSANKLAGKHRRRSLIHDDAALCDICKEKRGLLFCQQDRAILCRNCDSSTHSNSLTAKHSRFLLTGAMLSDTPTPIPTQTWETVTDIKRIEDQRRIEEELEEELFRAITNKGANSSDNGSTISEYLTTLPGWHVEDFLLDDAGTGGGCVNFEMQGNEFAEIVNFPVSVSQSAVSAVGKKKRRSEGGNYTVPDYESYSISTKRCSFKC